MTKRHSDLLHIRRRPLFVRSTLVLAFSGWMDGGDVSTGTVRRLVNLLDAPAIAEIDPEPFYIYNFPGSMEIAAMFRPTVKMKGGVIRELDMPSNTFFCDESANLIFFIGKEPNLRWHDFSDCIFQVAREAGVSRVLFIGSFGGTVPHTREPRMFGSISHRTLRPILQSYGVKPSDYKGPASFSTLLLSDSLRHKIDMLSLVAEIPGYLQGLNPLSIEAVTRRLSKLLNRPVDLDKLREASNEWELQVTEAVEKDAELAETVRKLEEQYDNELIKPEEE